MEGEILIYNSDRYNVYYYPNKNEVEISYIDDKKKFEATLYWEGNNLRSKGYIIIDLGPQEWSWSDEGDMPGLFWARIFEYFPNVPMVLEEIFNKTNITFEDFKQMLLRDIYGIVYHVTGDNETWEEYGGIFDQVNDYELEYIKDNYPEIYDIAMNVISTINQNDVKDIITNSVGKIIKQDIKNTTNVYDLEEILLFNWYSKYVEEASKTYSEILWNEIRKRANEKGINI